MGVFIKDMYLPDNCLKCPFAMLNKYGERLCYFTDRKVWIYDRHEECPLEEREED